MLRSMTAFGQHRIDTAFGELTWELRSVNHRYLDVSMRLPDNFRALEPAIRERCAARLHRGKLELGLRFRASGASAPLSVDSSVIERLATAIGQVNSSMPELSAVNPLEVLQWPGVLVNSAEDQQAMNDLVLGAFDSALDDFIATREREGGKTAELLQQRVVQIGDLVVTVRKHRPSVVDRQRNKLMAKLADLDVQHDRQRLEQELVYAAQRLDIDEELDRLDNHVAEFANVLQRDEPVGRRLDFLMQEFNREANTLGSKSADSDTTGASVEIKVLIEQMREQVQNIE